MNRSEVNYMYKNCPVMRSSILQTSLTVIVTPLSQARGPALRSAGFTLDSVAVRVLVLRFIKLTRGDYKVTPDSGSSYGKLD